VSTGLFRPGELWPDTAGVPINAHGGGILFHEGLYYWFGEHKIAGEEGNRAHVGVHVYSSADLHEWQDAGIALAVSDDPKSEIAKGCILERPKVIFNRRTGKFVMWFHLEPAGAGYTGARSGIAVADAPAGPYRFIESLRPNAGVWSRDFPGQARRSLDGEERDYFAARKFSGGPVPEFPADLIFRRDQPHGQMARDMTLFVDADEQAYQIYSSEENGTLHISRLTDDYLRPAGDFVRVFPGGFREAPAIMRRGARYFLFTSGCTGWRPNELRLAMAESIWGPWIDLGNPCEGVASDIATTFSSQPTFILPVADRADTFIFMADRWCPRNAIDGRHVWLPIEFRDEVPVLRWQSAWHLPLRAPSGS
jgi:hypothetical protein